MKKEFKIAIALILVVWIFIIGVEVGTYKEKKNVAENTTAPAPVITTTAAATEAATQATEPATQATEAATVATEAATQPTEAATVATEPSAPAEEVPSAPANADVADSNVADSNTPDSNAAQTSEAAPSEAAPAGDVSSLTNDQILENVVKYVNQLKSEQNMTAVKKEDIKVELTDLSVSAAKSTVQKIIDNLAGAEEKSYTFANGQAADGEGTVTPDNVIPPTNKQFALTSAGVASATAEKVGDNTVYTVKLVEESTTLESPAPVHNAVAIGYLDLAGLELPGVTLTKADMKYPGSTVSVTVDANGKVVGLLNEMPMTGVGEAKIGPLSGSASFGGALHEEWTFTY